MNGFAKAKTIEAEALVRLRPFLREHSDGQFVLIDKSPLARILQETIGDLLMTHRKTGRMVAVEVKAERKFTGNLFLETWSNRNLADGDGWEARGSNPGWLLKVHPTLLFYYFIDADKVYIIRMHRLVHWAYATPSKSNAAGATRINDFRCAAQSKYAQMNDTHGHLVPLEVIAKEVGYQLVNPLQLGFDFMAASSSP